MGCASSSLRETYGNGSEVWQVSPQAPKLEACFSAPELLARKRPLGRPCPPEENASLL